MRKIILENLFDDTYEFADFHDSVITAIHIDYVARTAKLTISLHIGNIEIESE